MTNLDLEKARELGISSPYAVGFMPYNEVNGKIRTDLDAAKRQLAMDGIRALFSARPASPEENHTKTSNDMNQDYKNVMAVLQADSLAAQDGKVVLSAEQMTALDTRLSSLAAEKQQQEQQIADLQAQVANLQKQDGDHTQKVEDVLTDTAEDYAARARAAYKQLKGLD